MKFPVIITMLAGVLTLAGPALAEDYVPPTRAQVSETPCQRLQADWPHAFLTLSSIHLEIQKVRETAAEMVEGYLAQLALAQSEDQAEFLVRQIQTVEMDQTICILKIQVKHARKAGQYDLVRTLQKRILEVLESDVQVATLERTN